MQPVFEIAGRYAAYQQLAVGGMATIYLGRQLGAGGFRRAVAIKRMHPHLAGNPEFARMFREEARLAARIRHPNIAPIIDVVADARELVLIMDYVHGETLARLAARDRVPIPIAGAIAVALLRGLHAAHEARDERGAPLEITHRDVSPHNVLIGSDGVARLIDFGIAHAAGRDWTTRTDRVKGRIAYMAPEQLRGADVDRRADVYAAGVVLWELLAGRPLIDGPSHVARLASAVTAVISAPSKHASGVSAKLDRLVLRALDREPSQRFATARAMADALEHHGSLASASEIEAWVLAVAHDALDERARVVRAIETLDPEGAAAPASTRRRWPAAAAAIVATAGLVGWRALDRADSPATVRRGDDASIPTVHAPSERAVPAAAVAAPAARPPAPRPRPPNRGATAKHTERTRPACVVRFRIEADGILHPYDDCSQH